jgi:hypothetical protein
VHWLAVSPTPAPRITPGTTTPIGDLLMWAHLDFFITLGALLASIAQIVAVLRTLLAVTKGRGQQAELIRMQQLAFDRQAVIMRYLGLETDTESKPPDDG